MEFQYNAPSAQPYHQFMPIPSLSPSYSGPDDFSTSPPDAFETLPQYLSSHHPPFDYRQGFHAHPSQPATPLSPVQNDLGPTRTHQHYHIMKTYVGDSGTSEENDPLTPAQSRRKAQNRAAQQAFRRRKEKHVKELEAKLAELEAARQQVSVENERLKQDIRRASTENEILRATSQVGGTHKISSEPTNDLPPFNSSKFYSNILQNETNKTPSHRIITSHDGERLLAAGATWDLIINHKLFKKGLVDVGDVSERLKHYAYCDGQGPVYSERSIIMAIEQSVISKTDNLL
ncbi:hypothetical protein BGZ61DRAFT_445748 [Ilyonectria robusta]|uniref:uncharacterized protein n=1 Tax=Ilyonectria robusta TaxID=1079257 RepID=UPI001E8CAE4E|nr:uncharacterized protein BGZ61DRAFT_445748 [Ilyonectria robusta]KAH8734051.1 hypothetical protein BGZ61DRAFT_445748 [Ilyonectria robusta]